MEKLIKFFKDIENANNIALFAHMCPDTDAIASCLVLKKMIQQNFFGKRVEIFLDTDTMDEKYKRNEELYAPNDILTSYDIGIALDCASKERIGKWQNVFDSSKHTINIDHHATNTCFANDNIVMKSASTTEVLYNLFSTKELYISDVVCELCYAGVITDTNNLTMGSIGVNTYKMLSEIEERGIDTAKINESFFKSDAKNKIYLLKKAIDSLQFFEDDKIAIMKLGKEDIRKTKSSFEDTLGIVDHAIAIKDVQIAIIIIKKNDNSVYVSFRGKTLTNVGEIAKQFGGGGCADMAAFSFTGNLGEMKAKLIKACKQQIKEVQRVDDEFIS